MRRILFLLGKSLVIAAIAAAAGYSSIDALDGFAMTRSMLGPVETLEDEYVRAEYFPFFFYSNLLFSFCVVWPVATLIYFFAKEKLLLRPSLIILMALLSAVMIALSCFLLSGGLRDGLSLLVFFAYPFAVVILTFSLLGWLWLIRPERNVRLARHDEEYHD